MSAEAGRTAVHPPLADAQPGQRRWLSLVVIAVAQLMVALDATIVSIALPSAQRALHVSDAERQWVITASTAEALVHGYSVATAAAGGVLVFGAALAWTLIDAGRPAPHRAR